MSGYIFSPADVSHPYVLAVFISALFLLRFASVAVVQVAVAATEEGHQFSLTPTGQRGGWQRADHAVVHC